MFYLFASTDSLHFNCDQRLISIVILKAACSLKNPPLKVLGFTESELCIRVTPLQTVTA